MTLIERIKNVFRRSPDIDLSVKFSPVLNSDVGYSMGVYKQKDENNFADAASNISWVYTANSIFSETAAMLPLKIYQKASKTPKEVTSGIQWELWQNPSAFVTPMEFRQAMFGAFGFSGNAYLTVDLDSKQMWNLKPQDMSILASKDKFILYYLYGARTENSQKLDPMTTCHVKSYNPMSYFYGLSPLQAAWSQVNYLDKDDIFWETFWKEGGRLQGIFTADGALSEDSFRRLKEQLKQQYQGVRKMQANIVTDNGLKFEQLGVSQKDAQIIEKGKLTVLDVLAAYKIPPAIAGILDQANYSNMEVQERLFYMLCILPKLRLFEEAFTAHQFFGANGLLRYEFDLSGIEVLKDDEAGVVETAGKAVQGGLMTQNEARARYFNLPPLADGNALKPVDQTTTQNQFASHQAEIKLLAEPEKSPCVLNKPRKPIYPKYSKEEKDVEAKAYDDTLAENDNALQSDLAKILKGQKEIVLSNIRAQLKNYGRMILTKDESSDLVAGLDSSVTDVIKAFRDQYEIVVDKFGKRTKKLIERGAPEGFKANWNPGDPRIGRFIKNRANKFGKDVNDETIQMVRDTLSSGFDAGADISELTEMVSDLFNGMEDWRARRIARTETAAAAQEAINVGYQLNSDVVTGKEWVSARDNFVRDSHRESNLKDVAIPLTEDFVLGDGEACEGPLDPRLSAGNSVNCRCTTVPILDFEGVQL